MHLRGAGIGEADVNATRDQGPHQTFRTIHRSTPAPSFLKLTEDQSFLTGFVKGYAGIAVNRDILSLPLCGVETSELLGVGIGGATRTAAGVDPPSPTLPHKGRAIAY